MELLEWIPNLVMYAAISRKLMPLGMILFGILMGLFAAGNIKKFR